MRAGVSRLTVSAVVSTCGGARRSSDQTDEPASCASRSHSAQSTALRAAPAGSSSASCAREAPLAIACRADSICCSTDRSEEHTSELQSLMRISYAVFCLENKNSNIQRTIKTTHITHKEHHWCLTNQ